MKTVAIRVLEFLFWALIGFVIGMFLVTAFCGCAASIPPSRTTVEVEQMFIAPSAPAVLVAKETDADGAGPRFLAVNIKFGQIEIEDDCLLPEDSVERHLAYILGRAGVPQPDNLVVTMLRPSSLCEAVEKNSSVRLGRFGVMMRWSRISGEHFAMARGMFEEAQRVSAILP